MDRVCLPVCAPFEARETQAHYQVRKSRKRSRANLCPLLEERGLVPGSGSWNWTARVIRRRRKFDARVLTTKLLGSVGPLSGGLSTDPNAVIDSALQPSVRPCAISVGQLLKLAKSRDRIEVSWVESTWEKNVREYRRLMKTVENVNYHRTLAKPGSKARAILETKLAEVEDRTQRSADACFSLFGEILGVRGLEGYRKKDYDAAMEQCFGSLDKDGDGNFPLRTRKLGLRPWPVHRDPEEANRMFSLYLARKVFCPVSVKKQEMMLEGFYGNVCTPPAKSVSEGMRAYFKDLVDLVFDVPDFDLRDEYFPTHSSGCAESKVSEGGKRRYFYDTAQTHYERGKVTPVSIYTGGKVRVITVDSCWNMRYSYLNRYMAGKIRHADWSVFGRSVAEWVKSNPEFLDLCDGEEFVSGDLESATDLLDSFFADTAIERLGEVFGLEDHEVEEMKAFTTHARLTDKFHDERQERGQLMGSVLSFPILCLVSFCFATYGTKLSEYVSRPDSDPRFQKSRRRPANEQLIPPLSGADLARAKKRSAIMRWKRCGINGDDVVLKDSDKGTRWANNVADGNGKVSRGKSPRSKFMFTINSEIWVRDEEGNWHPPSSIRPSLLAAIGASERKNPAMEWLEYSRSTLLSQEGKEAFSVAKVLKPHIPRRFGGLGLVRKWDPRLFLESWIARKELQESALRVRPNHIWNGHRLPYEDSKKVLVTLTREAAKDVGELLYDTKLPQWTETVGNPIERAALLACQQWSRITHSELTWLKTQYDRAMDLELAGLVQMKVPQELSCLFEQSMGESPFRGSTMTSGTLSRIEREVAAMSETDEVCGLVRSPFDDRMEQLACRSMAYQQEALEEMRKRDAKDVPWTFGSISREVAVKTMGRPIDRSSLRTYKAGDVGGWTEGKVEDPRRPEEGREPFVVLPAGYPVPRFSRPSTSVEDRLRREQKGTERGKHNVEDGPPRWWEA